MFACLAACQKVSVGEWDVEIDSNDGVDTALWTITAAGSISMTGSLSLVAEEVDLVGSRIHWASGTANEDDPTGPSERVSFIGTVNGNTFSGTLYTTDGNMNVRGTRR